MLRLSNHDVPAREGLSYLHDFVARSVAGLQLTPKDKDGFEFKLAARDLDADTVVGSAQYSPVHGARTRELTADGRCNYMVTIHEHEYETVLAGGATLRVQSGDILIVNESMHHSFNLPGTRLTALVLEERRLASFAPAIRKQPIHQIAATAPGAALLSGYANLLLGDSPLDTGAAQLASNHLYQLAALTLDGREHAEPELQGIGGARLALIKRDMTRSITDPELDIAKIARRHRVSARYAQRLFEREGTNFGQFLRDTRLDLARAAIEAGDGRTISAIAFDCGFGDLSHFNKSFRQRFGTTPTDIRARTLHDLM